ncbi:Uncharacterised protein [Mycobacteroides abscessus subsp. abscessus]|nr:Uncharacterised protein [Mycobacteroides abscessus subsp. abscessus]
MQRSRDGSGEVRILLHLPPGVQIPLEDVDAAIPYMTEKWPAGGVPHRIEVQFVGTSHQVQGHWLVFRGVVWPEPEPDPDAIPIDWDRMREQIIRDMPRKKRKRETEESPEG